MTETPSPTHQDALYPVGRFWRRIKAGIDRIWDNVLDWEHLPHLHSTQFRSVRCIEAGPSGWEIWLCPHRAVEPSRLRLQIDRARNRYGVTTLAGPGIGSVIETALTPIDAHCTDVAVLWSLPVVDPIRRARLAAAYAASYGRLWDEDEAMMQALDAAASQDGKRQSADFGPCFLGSWAEIRARFPFHVTYEGVCYQVTMQGGLIQAVGARCPHGGGPIRGDAGGDWICPWHGYRFDRHTGVGPHGYRLAIADLVDDPSGTQVILRPRRDL